MSADTLCVGLAGAGMIGRYHLAAWRACPGAEVTALCDPSAERARRIADEFAIAGVFANVQSMLDATALHALDVASPRDTHAAIVRLGASRGLAVLCQKPLCSTLAEARALVASLPPGTRLMVHENWRFRPWYRTAKRWLDDGRVGTVRQARMSVSRSDLLPDASGVRPGLVRQPFFADEPRLLVAESLIHHLDVLRWLLGPLHVIAARTARTVDVVHGETLATALLETQAGAPVVLEANLAMHGSPVRAPDRLHIAGDAGTLALRGDMLSLDGGRPACETLDLAAGYQASFDAAIGHFVACLQRGDAFETHPEDNLHTLALVEAIYAAAG